MRFLLDADLPRSAADTVRRHGHEARDIRKTPCDSSDRDNYAAQYDKTFGKLLEELQAAA